MVLISRRGGACAYAQTRRSAPMGGRVRGVGARHMWPTPRGVWPAHAQRRGPAPVCRTDRAAMPGGPSPALPDGFMLQVDRGIAPVGSMHFLQPPSWFPLRPSPIPPLPRLSFRWSPTPLARGASFPVRNRSLVPLLGLIRRAPSVTFLAGAPKKVVILSKGSCHLAQRGRG